jgi:hypothetical protein
MTQLQEGETPATERERVKSLTIDVPASLLRRFKAACAAVDRLMVEEVLALIERRTGDLEKGGNGGGPAMIQRAEGRQ